MEQHSLSHFLALAPNPIPSEIPAPIAITFLLAQRQDVEMPITEQIYQMLFCGKSAQEVALSLLGRERKGE